MKAEGLKYTPSLIHVIILICKGGGPLCSGSAEQMSFQNMKFRCSHKKPKNVQGVVTT